jgi:hypothetical protein
VGRYSTVCFARTIVVFSWQLYKNNGSVMVFYRETVVRVVTGYGLDDRGVGIRVPVGSRIFSSPRRPDLSGVHLTSYPFGIGVFPTGVKRPGREADHSPPTSAEIEKMWTYTSTRRSL